MYRPNKAHLEPGSSLRLSLSVLPLSWEDLNYGNTPFSSVKKENTKKNVNLICSFNHKWKLAPSCSQCGPEF